MRYRRLLHADRRDQLAHRAGPGAKAIEDEQAAWGGESLHHLGHLTRQPSVQGGVFTTGSMVIGMRSPQPRLWRVFRTVPPVGIPTP